MRCPVAIEENETRKKFKNLRFVKLFIKRIVNIIFFLVYVRLSILYVFQN